VDSIEAVDAAAWDRIAGDNPLLGHGWLAVAERECLERLQRRYVLLERAGSLLAAAACYVDAGDSAAESVDDLLFGRLAGKRLGRFLSVRPALVCGFPWSLGSGCLMVPDPDEPHPDEPDRGTLADALVETITAEARRQGWTAVFLGVAEPETLLMSRLRARGYRAAHHEPLYVLDLAWPDFETYRQSLPSLNIRKNIRGELNRNRKQGVTIGELKDAAGLEQRLHAIVDHHFRRYGWRAFTYGANWFRSILSALGDDAVVTVAFQDDQPVGVAVAVRKRATRQLVLACVDHAGEGGNFTYFNLAYYRAVEDCIRAGDRRYIVGPGQHLSRSRRGYRPQASYVFCRPPGPVRRHLIGWWLRVLSAWLRRKRRGAAA